jgi:hypothetical protein
MPAKNWLHVHEAAGCVFHRIWLHNQSFEPVTQWYDIYYSSSNLRRLLFWKSGGDGNESGEMHKEGAGRHFDLKSPAIAPHSPKPAGGARRP